MMAEITVIAESTATWKTDRIYEKLQLVSFANDSDAQDSHVEGAFRWMKSSFLHQFYGIWSCDLSSIDRKIQEFEPTEPRLTAL